MGWGLIICISNEFPSQLVWNFTICILLCLVPFTDYSDFMFMLWVSPYDLFSLCVCLMKCVCVLKEGFCVCVCAWTLDVWNLMDQKAL